MNVAIWAAGTVRARPRVLGSVLLVFAGVRADLAPRRSQDAVYLTVLMTGLMFVDLFALIRPERY